MTFKIISGRTTYSSKFIAAILLLSINLIPTAPVFADFGQGAPTIPNAQPFGIAKETAKVDSFTGAFTQHIVLDIPPGRSGLQPDLALDYNSQRTQDSIVGYGWQLSIPYIQRLNKTGSQNLYNGSTLYYTSSFDGELANINSSPLPAATTSPSILDTLPLSVFEAPPGTTQDSRTYTVPSGGSNKLFIVLVANGNTSNAPSATLNGQPLTFLRINGSINRAYYFVGYLANPTSGTFTMNWSPGTSADYTMLTVKDAAQSNPIDANAVTTVSPGTSLSTSVTTSQGNDLLLSFPFGASASPAFSGFGTGETQMIAAQEVWLGPTTGSYKNAASTAGTETMTINVSSSQQMDEPVVAVKQFTGGTSLSPNTFKARVDSGTSLSYSFVNNTWTAYDKSGNRYLFGSDDSGRQFDTGSGTSTNTYKWVLQEIRDTNNNYVKFTYAKDSNDIYPSQILYTGNGSTDGIFKITFATSTRPDVRQSSAPGFRVTTNYRVSEIDAYNNGSVVRKYLLGYGPGINGKRSLLTSLQEQGYDENNTLTTLPAMTFTYASSSSQFYTTNGVNSSAYIVADINGDGLNEANVFTGVNSPYTNQPEYWASAGSPPAAIERGTRFIDVNADGKADLVRGWGYLNTFTLWNNNYSTSTGYSWATSTALGAIPVFGTTVNSLNLTTGIFGDVNGDGLPDYEASLTGYAGPTAYLGNGQGFDSSTYFVPAQSFPLTGPTASSSMLIDVNGDGLDDWLYSDGTSTYALLNNGAGWDATPATQWTIATSTLYKSPDAGTNVYYDRGIRFFDINGDGFPDFIHSYQMSYTTKNAGVASGENGTYSIVYLNTGNGWATSTAYTLPSTIVTGHVTSGNWDGTFTYNEYGNWIGNGQFDQDVMTTVSTSKGGQTSVTYAPTTNAKASNPELPYSLLVVTAMGVYDGLGNAATTTYSYSGGKQYTTLGVRDRKFAGFASTTMSAPDSLTNTYFDQGMSTTTSLGEQADGYGQINHPFRKDIFDLAGNLSQKTFYRWDTQYNGNSVFVGLARQVQQDYASDSTHRDSATDYLYASTTNDLIKKTQYGEVTGNDDGTFTDIGTDKRIASTTYAASSTVNLTVPIEATVLDSNSATSSDEKLYYDGLPFGQVSLGNLTKQQDWISTTTYASSTKTYNAYGLVATSTDRRGYATGYKYDAFNLYVATATNPLGQQTQYLYNYATGKAKQTTDPNGRLAKNIYDGVGRLVEVDQSDTANPAQYATSTTYQYTDNTATPSIIHRADYLTATNTVDTYDFYDGLNRIVQERKASQTAGTYVASDRLYSPVGLLGSTSLPYFSSGSGFTNPTSINALYTTYTYDPLKRVLITSNAVGSTTNTYAKWTTTTTDPNGNIKDYVLDAFGNLASVVEHNGSLATTAYTFDAANNLATTTDSQGNVRAFTYDGLGRRLTAQDLHAATHTPFGSWSYSYDDAGNMVSQVDPKGSTTTRTYDALGRLLTETNAGSTQVTNTYDSCTNGIGYLCIASSTAAKTQNAYDILGRITYATTTIAGSAYTTGYTYDRQGNVSTLTYPNGSQVSYAYNLAGQPSTVQTKPSGGSWATIASSLTYAPQSVVTSALFGNGASSTWTFNPNALYRLAALQTQGQGGTSIQNFVYTYDAVGNITNITNTASTTNSGTSVYSYDSLNRLASASLLSATLIGLLDSLPVTLRQSSTNVTSDSFTYTVPQGGANKLLVVLLATGADKYASLAATQNGVSLTCQKINGSTIRATHYYCYLASPASGTFSISWSGGTVFQYSIFTLQNAAQTNPIDAAAVNDITSSGSSVSTNVTTTQGNDLLLDHAIGTSNAFAHTFGTNQVQTYMGNGTEPLGKDSQSYKPAAASVGTETMTRYFSPNDNNDDLAVIAVKQLTASTSASNTPYVQSFSYDWLGNLLSVTTSVTNGATSTSSSTIPTILDSLPVTTRYSSTTVTSDSFTYTVPASGANKLLAAIIVVANGGPTNAPSATQNGSALTCSKISGSITRGYHYICYRANPSSGTFSVSWTTATAFQYSIFTLQNAAQSSPIDVSNVTDLTTTGTSLSTNVTTTQGNDLLLDECTGTGNITTTYGASQSEIGKVTSPTAPVGNYTLTQKNAASTAGTESMSRTFSPNDNNDDLAVVAVKGVPVSGTSANATTTTYAYPQTGYRRNMEWQSCRRSSE